jgi:hypothetical protein
MSEPVIVIDIVYMRDFWLYPNIFEVFESNEAIVPVKCRNLLSNFRYLAF